MTGDAELLGKYAAFGEESAFGELVRRHLPLVYSAALRQVAGDTALARDVAQTVFIDLARKPRSVRQPKLLAGWLYSSTRFAAINAIREQQRRRHREQTAARMQELATPPEPSADADWNRLMPVLDEVMAQLDTPDRDAVLLRFFQKQGFREIGAALGVSEDAARMRVTRALDELRRLLQRRGVALPAAALAAALTGGSVEAAPPGIESAITSVALSAASTGIPLLFLAKALSLLKTPAIAGLALVVAGTFVTLKGLERNSIPIPQTTAVQRTNLVAKTDPTRVNTSTRSAESTASSAASEPLPANRVLRLKIVDKPTKQPLARAKVQASCFPKAGESQSLAFVSTEEGVALLSLPAEPHTRCNIFVTASGHVPKVLSWSSETLPSDYTLALGAGTAMGGRVVDETGNPIQGAIVILQGHDFDTAQFENIQLGPDTWQKTDALGFWLCNCVPEEDQTLQAKVNHPDFLPGSKELLANLPSSTNSVIVMSRGFVLSGRTQSEDGRPVANATIRILDTSTPWHRTFSPMPNSETKTATSDNAGRFHFNLSSAGQRTLAVQTKGWAPLIQTVDVSSSSQETVLTLSPGSLLQGTVADLNGNPISNALVSFEWDRQGLHPADWSSRTDAEGRFAWDSAPAEPAIYSFDASGYELLAQQLHTGSNAEHFVQLSPARTAAAKPAASRSKPKAKTEAGDTTGRVCLPDGSPALNTQVILCRGGLSLMMQRAMDYTYLPAGWSCARTDEAGKFTFSSTPPIAGFIAMSDDGIGTLEWSAFCETRSIALQPWGRVRGRIITPARLAEQTRVNFSNDRTDTPYATGFYPLGYQLTTSCDADGNFVFPRVPPGEASISYGIHLFPEIPSFYRPMSWTSRALFVNPGETMSVSLGKNGPSISGHVARLSLPPIAASSETSETMTHRAFSATLALKLPGWIGPRPRRRQFSSKADFLAAEQRFFQSAQAFGNSPDTRGKSRSYHASCAATGKFEFPAIPPGTYLLALEAYQITRPIAPATEASMQNDTLATLDMEIVVPEIPPDTDPTPIDLGTLTLEPAI
jgi:RNA polymerase sigma factor (sigma-70 family)